MLQQIFTDIYKTNGWHDPESVSGCGRTTSWTASLQRLLPDILNHYEIRTLLDAGCGDWNWMSRINFGNTKVTACDIVPDLVGLNQTKYTSLAEFFEADITFDPLPDVDLILCRTVLFHLNFDNILLALANIQSHCKYMLLTTHPHVLENTDIQNGDFRRINLCLAPIHLPEPEFLFQDGPTDDGFIGLWRQV